MNDDFLSQFRRPPRRAFARDLYARLDRERKPMMFTTPASRPVRWLAAGVAAFCLLSFTVLAVSPEARAAAGQIIRTIGGVTFDEGTPPPDTTDAVIVRPDRKTLAEVRGSLPFELRLPTWAPDGFMLEENEVQIVDRPGSPPAIIDVFLRWTVPNQPDRGSIGLSVLYLTRGSNRWIIGPNTVQEVKVNGQPAALVQGGGWEGKEWRGDLGWMLHWQPQGTDVTYRLSTYNTTLSPEDLIRMAESAR